MLSRLISFFTSNFRFANYTADRRRELIKIFSYFAVPMMLASGPLLTFSLYLAALLGGSGLTFAFLAGGVEVSDRIISGKGWRIGGHLRAAKAYVSQTHTCTRTYSHHHARSHRSASKSTFSRSSKGNSDSGESDSGDPPGPLPSVTPSLYGTKKPDHSPLPLQSLGCWCMACEQAVWGCFA